MPMDKERMSTILGSMDSEWDKTCAWMVFAMGKTREVVESCGIDVDALNRNRTRFFNICSEISNIVVAAQDIVSIRLSEKREKLTETLKDIETKLEMKKNFWSKDRIDEL